MTSDADITALLVDWNNGDKSAMERLLPLVERELHRLAHSYMRREDPNHTLQTTALINETYLRLIDHPLDDDARRPSRRGDPPGRGSFL